MPKAKPKNGPLFDPVAFGRLIDAAVETFLRVSSWLDRIQNV